ncbi:MAG: AAA family ATPase [Trueperaceae bacterium]
MRIARIQVDTYMGLRALDVDLALPGNGGLVVIEGPNEAGKTTLLRFVRQMLFGGSEEIRGALVIEHAGRRLRLVRENKGKRYALHDLEAGTAADVSLDAVVGHLDAKVYQSVFAFGLDELRTLASLTGGDVQERIYSASVAGAGRSARSALRAIEAEMSELLMPRAASARIALLAAALKDARKAADAARARAREYDDLRSRELDLDRRARAAQEALVGLQADKAKVEKVLVMWPEWRERMELLERLEDAGSETALDPRWLDAEEDVARLARELGAQRQRLNGLEQLSDSLARAETSVRVALGRLGEAWDEERVATFDAATRWRAIATGATQRQAASERIVRDTEVRMAAAERSLEAARERLTQAPGPADEEGVLGAAEQRAEERLARVAELEGAWDDRADAERSVHELVAAIAEVDTLARRGSGRRWLGWWLAVLAPLAGAAYLWGEPWAWPVSLAGLAAVLGALLWPGGARGRAAADDAPDDTTHPDTANAEHPGAANPRVLLAQELDRARRRRADVERHIDAIGAELELDPAAGRAAVRGAAAQARAERERATEALASHRAAARAHEQASGAVKRARDEVAAASEACAGAQRGLDEVSDAWRSWCERHGVPAWVGPGDLGGFVDGLGAAQEQVLRVRADRDRLVGQRREVTAFVEEARATRARLPVTDGVSPAVDAVSPALDSHSLAVDGRRSEVGAGSPAVGAGAALEVEIAWWHSRVGDARRRLAWRERVGAVEARLGTLFGSDAQQARALLDRREPLAWQAELARLERGIAEANEALTGQEGLVAQRRDAQRAREALEAAADLAQHTSEAEVLRAALTAAARRWLVLRLAADQIEGTLAEYQRNRVPAVLRYAGDTLAAVTQGRYVGVRQVDEETLTLVTPDERPLDAASVSRGTQEQLYLALRLGLVDAFAEQRGSLPLVMDDVLVNADPDRSDAMAQVIARAADRHQVLYLTCHPHTADRLRATTPGALRVRLERVGPA